MQTICHFGEYLTQCPRGTTKHEVFRWQKRPSRQPLTLKIWTSLERRYLTACMKLIVSSLSTGKHPTWCTASDHLLSILYPGVIGQFTGPIPFDGSSIPTCFRLNITRTQGCFFLHSFWISVLKFGKPLTCRVAAEAAKAAVFHHACKRTSWCRRSAIFGAS